jgi:hypothetical protein
MTGACDAYLAMEKTEVLEFGIKDYTKMRIDKLVGKILISSMGGAIGIGLVSCVEPFVAETETFVSALVVEATITNELKQQEVVLSRTFVFEENGPEPERNADVQIEDDMGTTYPLTEINPGTYRSIQAFAAAQGRSYRLTIRTAAGHSYASAMRPLTPVAEMEEVYAERTTIGGNEGMAIRVNTTSPSGQARNYRYEYEEVYKIIAPDWTPQRLETDPDPDNCILQVVPRENEERVCYTTENSNTIILTDTNSFPEDRVNNFVVRFINRNNYIISHRYSILLRQYVLSPEAYTFFETLEQFSGSESLFSQTQPGFLASNISSLENPEEKVLGYFDVATVSEKRVFFNYNDFFAGEPLPPYADACRRSTPPLASPGGCVLRRIVESNLVRYLADNPEPGPGEGPYVVVPRVCGDCTALGTIETPDFWVED